jgi:ubiquinol-cytochrome c reductase cytochrome c1 subunit
MIRIFAFLVGLAFSGVLAISLFTGVADYFSNKPEETSSHKFHLHPKDVSFSSDGPFGKYDNQQLQRGFQVYAEVCASCHGLSLASFRELQHIGYTEAEVKKIASDWKIQVPSINPDTGEAMTRKALASDTFPDPFPNPQAARASNNNAYPPDLTLITKAREGGAPYIYSLLTGYRNPKTYRNEHGEALPADVQPAQNLHFNPYFANLNIAMPPPLTAEGQVTYADGTKATVDQMAKDVSAFLVWTAEPELERRHASGLAITIFLLFATAFGYLAYRQIWAQAKRTVRVTGPLEPENQAKSSSAKRGAGIEG